MAIGDDQVSWTFLTNHGHVLLALAQDPEVRLRDVAATVGITERAVQAIVADLEAGGYLKRARVGRRNKYTLDHDQSFRHPAEKGHPIGDLLRLFIDDAERAGERAADLAGELAGERGQLAGERAQLAGEHAPGLGAEDLRSL